MSGNKREREEKTDLSKEEEEVVNTEDGGEEENKDVESEDNVEKEMGDSDDDREDSDDKKRTKRAPKTYVGNLSWQTTSEELREFLTSKTGGNLLSCEVLCDRSGKSRGCALVEFSTDAETEDAMKNLNKTIFQGRTIEVREDRQDKKGQILIGKTQLQGRLNNGDTATSRVVFVGNLSFTISSEDLKEAMSEAGTVESVEILKDREGRSKGVAIVTYSNAEESMKAITELHDSIIDGRAVLVREDRDKNARGESGGGRGSDYRDYGGRGYGYDERRDRGYSRYRDDRNGPRRGGYRDDYDDRRDRGRGYDDRRGRDDRDRYYENDGRGGRDYNDRYGGGGYPHGERDFHNGRDDRGPYTPPYYDGPRQPMHNMTGMYGSGRTGGPPPMNPMMMQQMMRNMNPMMMMNMMGGRGPPNLMSGYGGPGGNMGYGGVGMGMGMGMGNNQYGPANDDNNTHQQYNYRGN